MRKICLYTILLLAICSCHDAKNVKEEPANYFVNEYFYIDDSKCLHSDRNCFELLYNDVRDNYRVKFVTKDILKDTMFNYLCARCVDEVIYEEIQTIVKDTVVDYQPSW